MHKGESRTYLCTEGNCRVFIKWAVLIYITIKAAAINIFHDIIGRGICFEQLYYLYNVRMVQL